MTATTREHADADSSQELGFWAPRADAVDLTEQLRAAANLVGMFACRHRVEPLFEDDVAVAMDGRLVPEE